MPHIARGELWETSGRMEYYAENMYVFEQEDKPFVVKPANYPFHIQIYRSEPRSYRDLPTWLAPVQVRVLCISDIFEQYAREVHNRLVAHGVRSELDERASTLSYKIRATETMKIPYMVICGRREAEPGTISVRRHGGMDLGTLTVEDFVKTIQEESVPVK
ncbi:MAG: His/Gly/Thr/Pro-type tRNA ligase C-terminal domain-containing protein [Candidatus Bathyarchaeia archaeon]